MRTPLLLSSLIALGVLPPLPKPRTQEDLDREDAARRERVRADLVARGIDPEEVRAAEAEEAEALKVRSEAYKAAMDAGKFRSEATAEANAAESKWLAFGTLKVMSSGEGPHFGGPRAGKTSMAVAFIKERGRALKQPRRAFAALRTFRASRWTFRFFW